MIRAEVEEHGAPALVVDDSTSLDEVVVAVEERFADALDAGPVAANAVERRALLREANLAIVGQVRGYFARPWADGDPAALVGSFVCECGEATCVAFVDETVGAAADAAVVEPAHR